MEKDSDASKIIWRQCKSGIGHGVLLIPWTWLQLTMIFAAIKLLGDENLSYEIKLSTIKDFTQKINKPDP